MTEADIRAANVAAAEARHGDPPETLAAARMDILHLTHHVFALVAEVRRLQRQAPAAAPREPLPEGVTPTPGGRGWVRVVM